MDGEFGLFSQPGLLPSCTDLFAAKTGLLIAEQAVFPQSVGKLIDEFSLIDISHNTREEYLINCGSPEYFTVPLQHKKLFGKWGEWNDSRKENDYQISCHSFDDGFYRILTVYLIPPVQCKLMSKV